MGEKKKTKTKTNLNEPNVKILYPYVIEIHRKESTLHIGHYTVTIKPKLKKKKNRLTKTQFTTGKNSICIS